MAGAQEVKPQAPLEDRISEAREFLSTFVDSSAVPGLSVAVSVGDSFTWMEGFGVTDLVTQAPMTAATPVRIGSVSKALTGSATGLLVQEGKLDLEAPVQTYVPEFPVKEWPISCRQVAGHLGGIRHYRDVEEAFSTRHFTGVVESLSMFSDDPLVCEPGSQFRYSTYGYTLLSAVLERAADVPFLQFMREHLFAPVGMSRTGPEWFGQPLSGQATGYELGRDREAVPAPEVDMSNKWGGGGFVSTAEDLMIFVQALLDGTLLLPETLDLIWTSQKTVEGEATGYGIGWFIGRGPGERRMVYHGGSAVGGMAILFVFPDDETIFVFTLNMGNAPIQGVPRKVVELVLGEPW